MNETRLPSRSAAATYSVSVPPGTLGYSPAALVHSNQPAQPLRPLGGEQIAHIDFHEVAIGELAVAVGERELFRFDHRDAARRRNSPPSP